jgi:hypothetical protein
MQELINFGIILNWTVKIQDIGDKCKYNLLEGSVRMKKHRIINKNMLQEQCTTIQITYMIEPFSKCYDIGGDS